jgi:CBS domain-containing protein
VADVMAAAVVTVPESLPTDRLVAEFFLSGPRKHQGYPVVDGKGRLLGVVTRSDVLERRDNGVATAGELVRRKLVTAFPLESCRAAAERMAETGVGRLVVVSADDPGKLVGIVTRSDLLKPRSRSVEEESKRERFLRFGRKSGRRAALRGVVGARNGS